MGGGRLCIRRRGQGGAWGVSNLTLTLTPYDYYYDDNDLRTLTVTVTLTLPYSFLYYSKFTKPNFPDEMKTEEEIRATLKPRLLSRIDTYLQAKIEAGAEAAPLATAVGPPASPSTPAAPGPSRFTIPRGNRGGLSIREQGQRFQISVYLGFSLPGVRRKPNRLHGTFDTHEDARHALDYVYMLIHGFNPYSNVYYHMDIPFYFPNEVKGKTKKQIRAALMALRPKEEEE